MAATVDVEWAMQLLPARMRAAARSEVPLVEQAALHIIDAGGKRLRPRLLFTAFVAAGGTELESALPLATAIELIHTATLVHDDINDHSALRRGRPTINARWGRTIALLTGDFLFARAYKLVADQGDRFNALLAAACTALVEGEVLQAEAAKTRRFDRETYEQIIKLKTAALFSCAAQLGAVRAGAPETHVQAVGEYAHDLGLAFQIVDDVLDLTGDPAVMGKPAHEDLPQHKLGLIAAVGGNGSTEGKQARDTDVMTLPLMAAGLADEARAKANDLADRARAALQVLPPSPARDDLEVLAREVVTRDR